MDDDFDAEAEFAQGVWSNGSNDDVWEAIFDPTRSRFFDRDDHRGTFEFVAVASELLDRIERTPDFTVGDLTHVQVIAAVHRRYPILGPNPF